MTAPRLRQHTDGRIALYDPTDSAPPSVQPRPWRRVLPEPTWGNDWPRRLTDAEVHGEGWSEAALVALPEPVVTMPVAWSATAKCGPVTARCFADGTPQINSGVQSYRDPADARRYAAGLLAAADWCDRYQRGETP